MACYAQFKTDQGSNDLEQKIIQDATTLQSLNGDSRFPASMTYTDKYSETEDYKRSLDIEPLKCSSLGSEVNILQEQLDKLGLLQEHIEYIIENGEKLMNKPLILSKKLKITIKIAEKALGILKMYKQTSTSKVSPEIISKIQDCLKENPEIENHEDISILCDIEEALISEYFRTQPLTEKQKFSIKEKYNAGYPISDIANILKISEEKVKKYVEESFLTFSDEEGKIVLEIIQNIIGEITPSNVRKKIIDRDLKLQDQLCCILPDRNDVQYNELKKYFKKFEESKYFFELDTKLTTEDISYINQYGAKDIEELSIKLQKVESVIRKYLEQYHPDQKLIQQCQIEQNKQIQTYWNISEMKN
ncbi:hypothetical protein LOD99_11776 [Oopsacas minuta]|uniref:Uncharacterized protein n=1 Tax=Oopsacas minuta TaxID=111878 RepID=A0AAV7JKG6_9METZ|nr:hypothetical protein LOD99_11776 [Oopsacas minuta]